MLADPRPSSWPFPVSWGPSTGLAVDIGAVYAQPLGHLDYVAQADLIGELMK
jgi:hypothetical protein